MRESWIKIEYKQPDKNEMVLGFRPFAKELGDDEITVLKYEGYVNYDHKGRMHRFERAHVVTHWQPLQNPTT